MIKTNAKSFKMKALLELKDTVTEDFYNKIYKIIGIYNIYNLSLLGTNEFIRNSEYFNKIKIIFQDHFFNDNLEIVENLNTHYIENSIITDLGPEYYIVDVLGKDGLNWKTIKELYSKNGLSMVLLHEQFQEMSNC